jgi:transposase
MRFYTTQHQFYCGIDLHARSMFLCIMDQSGKILLHRNYRADPDSLLRAIGPYREDLVVAAECIFTWYWIADLCSREGITFVLGHALYMKAIHGSKTKNDRIDSQKIAALLRSGMLPMADVYPQGMRFSDPVVRTSVEVDAALMDAIHQQILTVERQINAQVPEHDPVAVHLLRSIPGVGKTLALVILYEIHDINRFPAVGNFISYARLVKCTHESGGKRKTGPNNKIGNVHLKWAFSEAVCLFLRKNERAKLYHRRLVSRYGKAKALSIIAQKLGRTVYTMLKRRTPFDARRFFETLT